MESKIVISSTEKANGCLSHETHAEACRLFHDRGAIVLEGALDKTLVEEMNETFKQRHASYFADDKHKDALRVGDKRFMITVDVAHPFSDYRLLTNPYALPIVRSFLGAGFVLGSCGAVVALPGAQDQHIHRDHPGLFDDERMNCALPPHAITMIVPLVELTQETGTTQMWLGSHHVPKNEACASDCFMPYVHPGTVLLMDGRTIHRGAANESSAVRPVLYNEYWRPWFRDHKNYFKQAPLRMSRGVLASLPAEIRALLGPVKLTP